MKRSSPERLLYLSPSPLSSFAQRPHHFVHWFHQRYKAPVFWIDPGPSRLPRASDWPRLVRHIQRLVDRVKGVSSPVALGPEWRQASWLQHSTAPVLPIEPYALGRIINQKIWRSLLQRTDNFVTPQTVLVMGKPCALSLALASRYPQNLCVFDAMDHMPGFCKGVSRRWMFQAEAKMAQQAHVIWASSHALAQIHEDKSEKVSIVLNALTSPPKPTTARTRVQGEGPVLGYLGVIDRWFDWTLIHKLADQYPLAQIHIIGPIHSPSPTSLPDNVQCFPPIPQHQIYQAMARFDVGLIPFALNEVTHYVDPVKYYEYRALGLPVLSTRFGQMAHRNIQDGVHFWDELESGVLQMETLVESGSSEAQRKEFCNANTWATRFDAVAHTLG